MSWIKSISVSGDDVFDEDADDISLQNREWKHNMEKRVKDGYVEGIDAAKAAFLQVGFNLGYKEGAHKTVALGRLKGIVSAIQCWCRQRPAPNNSIPVSVSGLLQRVDQHEERLMKEMRQALEKPPVTASTVSDSLDDLGVHPGEEENFRAPGQKDEGSTGVGGGGGCGGGGCGRLEGGEEGGCCGGGGCGKLEGGEEGGCCGGGGCGKLEGGEEGGCCGGGGCGKLEGGEEGGCCGGGGCGKLEGGEEGGCCGGGGCGKLEGGEGGGCRKESGAGGGGECNKTDCCRKGGEEKMELGPCSRASSSSISSAASSRSFRSIESLHELVQECQELMEVLGLPQELIIQLQLLRSMP